MGGRQLGRHLSMNSWPAISAMLLSNAVLELEPTIWHARHPFGRRRMCCAQTAAPEGKKKKRMEMQKRGDCCIKSIITECSKKHRKITFCDRFGLQIGPRFVPETLRGPLGALGRVSERSRDARGTLRRGFGDAPGRRSDAPGAPWDAPGTLREASGHPKIEPSEPQEAFPTGF